MLQNDAQRHVFIFPKVLKVILENAQLFYMLASVPTVLGTVDREHLSGDAHLLTNATWGIPPGRTENVLSLHFVVKGKPKARVGGELGPVARLC